MKQLIPLTELGLGDALELVVPKTKWQEERTLLSGPYKVWSVLEKDSTTITLGRPYLIDDNPKPGVEKMVLMLTSDLMADRLKCGWPKTPPPPIMARVFEMRLGA